MGGFPEVFQLENKELYIKELFSKIILRDVLDRYNLKFSNALKELAIYLTYNCSSLFSYQKLSRLFGISSVHTVKNYVGYLQETY